MIGLKRNNISYKEKGGRPRNAQKYKKPNSAAEQLAQASPFLLERECSSDIFKIDAFLTQASYLSLWRESARTIGSFYVLINKPINATQEVS